MYICPTLDCEDKWNWYFAVIALLLQKWSFRGPFFRFPFIRSLKSSDTVQPPCSPLCSSWGSQLKRHTFRGGFDTSTILVLFRFSNLFSFTRQHLLHIFWDTTPYHSLDERFTNLQAYLQFFLHYNGMSPCLYELHLAQVRQHRSILSRWNLSGPALLVILWQL